MRKINIKHKTLIIWAVVLGIISLIAIVLVILGALIKTNLLKISVPAPALLIPGLVFAPWTIPLFILVTITSVIKKKQIKDPSLIDKHTKTSGKDVEDKNHAISKMHDDYVKHTKENKN